MARGPQDPDNPNKDESSLIYSTTEGRARFADIIQSAFGEKAVIGFDRYGRVLGALVPVEAVLVLANREGEVDELVRMRIQQAAERLADRLFDEEEGRVPEGDGPRHEGKPRRYKDVRALRAELQRQESTVEEPSVDARPVKDDQRPEETADGD